MALIRIDSCYIKFYSIAEHPPTSYIELPKIYKEDIAKLSELVESNPKNADTLGGLCLKVMEIKFNETYSVFFLAHLAIGNINQTVFDGNCQYTIPVCPPADRKFSENGEPRTEIYCTLQELKGAFDPTSKTFSLEELNQLAIEMLPAFGGFDQKILVGEEITLGRIDLAVLFKEYGVPIPPEERFIQIFGPIAL
jgi:hypothetical protein